MHNVTTLFILFSLSAATFGGLRADLDGNGRVDLSDLAILAEEWMMAETPSDLEIVGTLTPDATGVYGYAGDYNATPYYARTEGGWFLWYCEALESDVISSAVGNGLDAPHWRREIADPIDHYNPVGGAAGVAVVEAARAKRVFIIEQKQPVRVFGRNSIAFLDGGQVAANTARVKSGLLVNTSDGELITNGGEGGKNVRPFCTLKGWLYGVEEATGPGRLCRSSDGVTWSKTGLSTTLVSHIFQPTPQGSLLLWRQDTRKLFRSPDDGATLTEIVPDRGAFNSTVDFNPAWNFATNDSIMMLAEYGGINPLNGRYIYRSVDDGVSWQTALDADTLTGDADRKITHWHTIGYHAATNRWIAASGDGQKRRWILFSADAGATWQSLIPNEMIFSQPVVFLDYGDPQWLLTGGDDSISVGKLNVLTGERMSVFNDVSRKPLHTYFFDLRKIDGLFYAFHATTNATVFDHGIFVSEDGENWTAAHRFAAAEQVTQCYFAGVIGGKIHCNTIRSDNIFKHFKMSPARLIAAGGVLISPANTNLMSETNSTFPSGGVGSWVNGGSYITLSSSTDNPYHGAHCLRGVSLAGSPGASMICPNAFTLEVGKTYVISLMVRGDHSICGLRIAYEWSPRGDINYHSVDSRWKQIMSVPYTVQSGEGGTYTINLMTWGGPNPINYYVDSIQVTECPAKPWQVGGTPQVQDALTETVTVGKVWTDVFAVNTLWIRPRYAADSARVIKTWAVGNNSIAISYDPADFKFKLTRTIAGSAQTAILSAAQYWHGNTALKFALRVSGAATSLTIQNGRAIETLSDGGISDLLDGEIVGTYGDFPMCVLTGWNQAELVPLWVSDDDITRVMNLQMPSYESKR